MQGQRADSRRTQARLITTAEQLFADRGIDSVSLSEINRAAGQRNKSALHYHFGDRQGLLIAILRRHLDSVEKERVKLIKPDDDLSSWSLNRLMETMVRPLYSKLDDPKGGVHYLRIRAQLSSNPPHPASRWISENLPPTMTRIVPALYANIPPMPDMFRLRRTQLMTAALFEALNAETYAPVSTDPDSDTWRDLQISDLTDTLCGLLTAGPSPQTAGLLASPTVADPAKAGLGVEFRPEWAVIEPHDR